jgi:ArsR family transcriptional regulator
MSDSLQLLKALADQTRLRILHVLSRRELCVCQIVDILGMGQSKVSRHLAHLRHAGLVRDRRDGLWIHYSLAEPSGSLHRAVTQWLKRADSEIPFAASDLQALAAVAECGDLCPEHPSDKESLTCGDVAPVAH